MANAEHLAKLKEGPIIWNQWRASNHVDFINLGGAYLDETDLRGANLSRAYLGEARLLGADLSDANLSSANLFRADLTEANLSSADLSGADLYATELTEANLTLARLSDANLWMAVLRWANLGGAKLSRAYLSRANLGRADLSESDLSGADLSGADLSGADLSGADLTKTNLICASLLGAILDRATAHDVRLWETQRTGWSIKGFICERAYWDEKGVQATVYARGEFERLYSEQPHAAQIALRDEPAARWEIEKRLLLDEVFPRLLAPAGPHIQFAGPATGVLIASGQASVNAQITANNLAKIQPLLEEIARRSDELNLPKDQEARLENAIQSVEHELKKSDPKPSIVTSGLKVVKDIAVKVLESTAEKGLTDHWHLLLNQLTHLMSLFPH
jgi:uncharacterized protein YjbI with pentapeptide repeats